MKKYYSCNTLARLARVSVRTLHHYDDLHILKPHHRTAKNHRRYGEDEVRRLQQISLLKFIGLTLPEIKNYLKDFNISDSLKIQKNLLHEQAAQIQKIIKLIDYLIIEDELQKPFDWNVIIQLIDALKNNKCDQQWGQKLLTQSEQQEYNQIGLKYELEWKTLLHKIQDNVNLDPESIKSKKLISKLLNLASKRYGNQPELIFKLWEAFKAGIIPSQLSIDQKTIMFIEKVYLVLQREKGINLKVPETFML